MSLTRETEGNYVKNEFHETAKSSGIDWSQSYPFLHKSCMKHLAQKVMGTKAPSGS